MVDGLVSFVAIAVALVLDEVVFVVALPILHFAEPCSQRQPFLVYVHSKPLQACCRSFQSGLKHLAGQFQAAYWGAQNDLRRFKYIGQVEAQFVWCHCGRWSEIVGFCCICETDPFGCFFVTIFHKYCKRCRELELDLYELFVILRSLSLGKKNSNCF